MRLSLQPGAAAARHRRASMHALAWPLLPVFVRGSPSEEAEEAAPASSRRQLLAPLQVRVPISTWV